MGSDLVVVLILVVLVLSYVSLLLTIQLGSLGVPRRQIRTLILEVWLTFTLMVGMFALLQRVLGPAPARGFPGDLFLQISRVTRLPYWPQLAVYGGLVAVVALFVHLLRSLRIVQQRAAIAERQTDGDSDDSVT